MEFTRRVPGKPVTPRFSILETGKWQSPLPSITISASGSPLAPTLGEDSMARYRNQLPTRHPPDQVHQHLANYLTSQGFRLVDPQQNVWQKGMGLMLGPQFVRYESHPGQLLLEAWIKFALLPGVYLGEMGIDGVFAFIPKKMLKGKVQEIERMVMQ